MNAKPSIKSSSNLILSLFKSPSNIPGAVVEREIRFGYFVGDRFNTSIQPDIFWKLVERLGINDPEVTSVEISGNQRKITNKLTKEVIYQNKFSNMQDKIDIREFGLRASRAIEQSIPPFTFNGLTTVRNRLRFIKAYPALNLTFHLTQVESLYKKDDKQQMMSYEVEVELPDKIVSLNEDAMANLIQIMYRIVYDTVNMMSLGTMRYTINIFNETLSNNYCVLLSQWINQRKMSEPSYDTQEIVTPQGQTIYRATVTIPFQKQESIAESDSNIKFTNPLDARNSAAKTAYFSIMKNPGINFQNNHPIDLNQSRFQGVMTYRNYAVSRKADGTHGYFMANQLGAFIFPSKYLVNKISTDVFLDTVILEGEIISDKNQVYFLAFDLLYHGNTAVMGEDYTIRYATMKRIIQKYNDKLPIGLKQVYMSLDGIHEIFNKDKLNTFFEIQPKFCIKNYIIKEYTVSKYETDGMVFTFLGNYSTNPSYKWKPLDRLTIDFYIDSDGLLKTKNKMQGLIPFRGSRENPLRDQKINQDRKNVVGEFLPQFTGDKITWKLIRYRWDKPSPNNENVAQDVWNVINAHISPEALMGNDMFMLRKWHNKCKKTLIMQNVKYGDVVLDIGGGRGGDIEKYIQAGASLVVYIEPNSDNLAELQNRLKTTSKKSTKFLYHKAMGQDTDSIVKFLKENKIGKVNVISLFFCLTFFYGNKTDLRGLSKTICSTIQPIGKIIGTTMDGRETQKIMALTKNVINLPQFKIAYTGKEKEYTPQVEIKLPENTIVGTQIENLVYFNKFTSCLKKKCNINESFYNEFPGSDTLSDSQTKINSLYKSFVLYCSNVSIIDEVDKIVPMRGGFHRAGVLGDGSCFVHSLLYCLDLYRDKTNEERKEFVDGIRSEAPNYVAKFITRNPNYSIFTEDQFKEGLMGDKWIEGGEQIALFCFMFNVNILVVNSQYELKTVNGNLTKNEWSLPYPITVVMINIDQQHFEPIFHYDIVPCDGIRIDAYKYTFFKYDSIITRILELGYIDGV